jgi:peptide/nickel transport system substrate-binding protein
MKRLALILIPALLVGVLAACAGETEIIREVVTVEVEKIVEREVIREIEVEKIVTVEVMTEVEVEREVVVEREKIVTVEVEKIVEVERDLPEYQAAELAKYGGTLRVVSQASVESLDQSFTGAWVTTVISAHIWDRPFERDVQFNSHPQMVESWTVNEDSTLYTFTLRDGLMFHDGAPVTADDVVPALKRMWVTQAHGQLLDAHLVDNGMTVINAKTWRMQFDQPVGFVIDGLAPPWPFSNIIPKRVSDEFPAQEDFGEENAIGSGPYKLETWERGNRIVLERFEEYVPRGEPSSFMSGTKNAYVDRIEWLEIPAEETKIAGLKTGEWDVIDGAGLDFYQEMVDNPDINVAQDRNHISNVDFNNTSSPADNKMLRQAVLAAIDVDEIMPGIGPDELWFKRSCRYCSQWNSAAGAEKYDQGNMELAQQLLADSGYDGETFLLMNPNDYATITYSGLIMKPLMEEIGINVEMPGMDWATLLSRLPDPDWDMITDWWVEWIMADPIMDPMASCTLYFGNWGDTPGCQTMLANREIFAFSTDPVEKQAAADAIQLQLYEDVPHIYFAWWSAIYPYQTYVKNFSVPIFPVFMNVWMEK